MKPTPEQQRTMDALWRTMEGAVAECLTTRPHLADKVTIEAEGYTMTIHPKTRRVDVLLHGPIHEFVCTLDVTV